MPEFKDLIKKDQQGAWGKEVEKARLELQKKEGDNGQTRKNTGRDKETRMEEG